MLYAHCRFLATLPCYNKCICTYLCQMMQGTCPCCQAACQLGRRHTAAVQAVYYLLGSWQQHCQPKGLFECCWQTCCHPAHAMSHQALVHSVWVSQQGLVHSTVHVTRCVSRKQKAEQIQIMCRLCAVPLLISLDQVPKALHTHWRASSPSNPLDSGLHKHVSAP